MACVSPAGDLTGLVLTGLSGFFGTCCCKLPVSPSNAQTFRHWYLLFLSERISSLACFQIPLSSFAETQELFMSYTALRHVPYKYYKGHSASWEGDLSVHFVAFIFQGLLITLFIPLAPWKLSIKIHRTGCPPLCGCPEYPGFPSPSLPTSSELTIVIQA